MTVTVMRQSRYDRYGDAANSLWGHGLSIDNYGVRTPDLVIRRQTWRNFEKNAKKSAQNAKKVTKTRFWTPRLCRFGGEVWRDWRIAFGTTLGPLWDHNFDETDETFVFAVSGHQISYLYRQISLCQFYYYIKHLMLTILSSGRCEWCMRLHRADDLLDERFFVS